jgi:hypothetical protein
MQLLLSPGTQAPLVKQLFIYDPDGNGIEIGNFGQPGLPPFAAV